MVTAVHSTELKLVREADGLDVDMLPLQGLWTEHQYLKLSEQTNYLIEFPDGVMEFPTTATDKHQVISRSLLFLLHAFIARSGGTVLYAPIRLRIREGKFRAGSAARARRCRLAPAKAYWLGADLVMEIVSPDDRARDTVLKRAEYAEAGIPEYWIVDPEDESITVLRLDGKSYDEHGVFRRGSTATSVLLTGLVLIVNDVFDAA